MIFSQYFSYMYYHQRSNLLNMVKHIYLHASYIWNQLQVGSNSDFLLIKAEDFFGIVSYTVAVILLFGSLFSSSFVVFFFYFLGFVMAVLTFK